ncbi:MAG TPA: hypothetical protein VNT75_11845 [Symbiobacteriaceae bacterium]|nr:hypothetical protein [Symbiobacteriaceae bacterium]
MQNPIREQIKLDGRWQTRPIDAQSVSAFVPGSWTDKAAILKPGAGGATAAQVNSETLQPAQDEPGWQTAPHLRSGQWNNIQVEEDLTGARLEASDQFHIAGVDASSQGKNALNVRIRLTGSPATPCLLSLHVSLTAVDGRLIGGMELVVSNKTRDLSAALPLTNAHSGPVRLKVTLCCGERVIDNARIDLTL